MNFQVLPPQGLIPVSAAGVPMIGASAPSALLGQHMMAGRGIFAAAPTPVGAPGVRPMMTQGLTSIPLQAPMVGRGIGVMALGRGLATRPAFTRPGVMSVGTPPTVFSPSAEGERVVVIAWTKMGC